MATQQKEMSLTYCNRFGRLAAQQYENKRSPAAESATLYNGQIRCMASHNAVVKALLGVGPENTGTGQREKSKSKY